MLSGPLSRSIPALFGCFLFGFSSVQAQEGSDVPVSPTEQTVDSRTVQEFVSNGQVEEQADEGVTQGAEREAVEQTESTLIEGQGTVPEAETTELTEQGVTSPGEENTVSDSEERTVENTEPLPTRQEALPTIEGSGAVLQSDEISAERSGQDTLENTEFTTGVVPAVEDANFDGSAREAGTQTQSDGPDTLSPLMDMKGEHVIDSGPSELSTEGELIEPASTEAGAGGLESESQSLEDGVVPPPLQDTLSEEAPATEQAGAQEQSAVVYEEVDMDNPYLFALSRRSKMEESDESIGWFSPDLSLEDKMAYRFQSRGWQMGPGFMNGFNNSLILSFDYGIDLPHLFPPSWPGYLSLNTKLSTAVFVPQTTILAETLSYNLYAAGAYGSYNLPMDDRFTLFGKMGVNYVYIERDYLLFDYLQIDQLYRVEHQIEVLQGLGLSLGMGFKYDLSEEYQLVMDYTVITADADILTFGYRYRW